MKRTFITSALFGGIMPVSKYLKRSSTFEKYILLLTSCTVNIGVILKTRKRNQNLVY